MTKSEALEFLELPETATDSEIKIRVEEKLAYFERLSEKAPSDFLRRLHARNAGKVSEILMASRKWPSYIPPEAEQPAPVPAADSTLQPESVLRPELELQSKYAPRPIPQAEVEARFEPATPIGSGPQAEPVIIAVEQVFAPEPGLQPEVPSEFQPRPLPEVQPEFQPKPRPQAPPEIRPEPQPEIVPQQPEPPVIPEPEPAPELPEPSTIPELPATPEPSTIPEPPVAPEPAPEIIPEPVSIWQPDPAPAIPIEPASQPEPQPVAWLIRHTENQSSRTFPVYPGKNFLGRKPMPGLVPFIEVEEDPYISKVHAVLYAEKADLTISDPSGEEGKPSMNGIFINAHDDRLTAKTRLKENDTIQVGVTKLIVRFNKHPLRKIVEEVEEQDYMHTVVINI